MKNRRGAGHVRERPRRLFVRLLAVAAFVATALPVTGDAATAQTLPELSVADVSVAESSNATLTVTLSAMSSDEVTVDYATSDGTATAGSDYTSASGTLTFSAGETSKTVSVTITDDTADEANETITFTLSNASNATISDASATVTITDNDNEPSLSVADVSVAESSSATVTVSLSAASGRTVTVDYATSDGTATAGSDYTSASGTLTFTPGQTSKTVSVTVTDDTADEANETITFTLSDASNATISDASATVTITDNDDAPMLSVGDVSVAESSNATVTVSLSAASGRTVTVDYATSDGTATAGSDYTSASGTLTFTPGQTSKTVSVTVTDDSTDEANETFTFTLSSPSNASISDASATVTITDNDPPPMMSVADATVKEGDRGVTLTVSLSLASGKTVTVDYATSNATAVAGSDYTAASGSLTFAAGETSKTVSVTITSDTLNEDDETFTFTLSGAVNATIDDASATVTIEDNPTLTVADVTVDENSNATLTVSLDVAGAADVTVDYATSNGTAVASTDYTAAAGTLTVSAGDTSGTVEVTISDDPTDEHDETFTFTLSGVANASISDSSATVTITDNDPPPTMSVADVTAKEGAGSVALTVSLSAASGKTVTVDYATSNGTATAGSDYTAVSDTLTFTPGQTSKTVSVTLASDTVDEDDETFTFTLSNPDNATFSDSAATVTIEDNPTLTVADVTVGEGGGSVTLTVELDVAGAANVTVDYATSNGTATAGSDYTAKTGELEVSAGDTSGTVSVSISDDPTDEHDETFTFTLSGVANASISDSSATVTITDNDPPPTMSVADVTVDEGAGVATLRVSLSLASGKTVTVNYATSDGTATAPGDYTAASGTLTFTPGDTFKDVEVTISDDPTDEHDETFTFTLSGANNANFSDSVASVTITDNDPPPTMSVTGGGTVVEAAGRVTLTVALSLASGKIVTVDYATADGTAAAPDDYTAASDTLTFTPGDESKTVDVTIISDTDDEDDEAFTFTLTNADNATLVTSSATVTIGDNPALSVADVEVNEDAGSAVFTVSLDMAGSFQLTVDYATSDGTAKAPADYTTTSGTLTFTAGTTSLDVEVPIADDPNHELNEDFAFTLSNPTNASISGSTTEGLIIDNESPETRSAPPVFAVFEVRLSAAGARDVTVDYATADGTAIAAVNYLARAGMLTIPAGERRGTIRVPIIDDAQNRPHRSFSLRLSNPQNARLLDARATAFATIRDGVGRLTIGDATATEGGVASFPVTLSAPSDEAVLLDYVTAGDTAVAGADYVPRRSRLIIPAGRADGTIRIRISDDLIDEPAETFALRITGVTNARGPSEPATGTILDNDSPPVLTVADVTASEDAGHVAFVVALSSPSAHFVSADFATLGRSATAGADYTATTGTVIIPPGWDRVIIRVPVIDDERDERDERFTLRLRNPDNVTLGNTAAAATIADDDGRPSLAGAGAGEGAAPAAGASVDDGRTPRLTVADGSATEGDGAVTFTVVIDSMSGRDVTVDYATSAGTATADEDYTPVTGKLTIPAGSGAVWIRVPVADDSLDEPAETFTLTLSAPVNATLADATVSATGTIVDDDDPPTLTAADATATEGDGTVTFTVTLDSISGRDVTVDYATSAGTATEGEDYAPVAGTLTIPAGNSGATIVVPVLGDAVDEPNETFTLTLSGSQNAVLSRSSITATIVDAAAKTIRRPRLAVADAVVVEGSGSVTLGVSLSRVTDVAVTVEYQTVVGVTTSRDDFSRTSGTLTVPPGQRTASIVVPITDDDIDEPTETFMLVVTAVDNAEMPFRPATVTILDNDASPFIEFGGVTIEVGDAPPGGSPNQ